MLKNAILIHPLISYLHLDFGTEQPEHKSGSVHIHFLPQDIHNITYAEWQENHCLQKQDYAAI